MASPVERNPYTYTPPACLPDAEGAAQRKPDTDPTPGPLARGPLSSLPGGPGPGGARVNVRASAGGPAATDRTGQLRADQMAVLTGAIKIHNRPLDEVLERARALAPNHNLDAADERQLKRAYEEVNRLGKPLTAGQEQQIQQRLSMSLQEPKALIDEALREFGATNPNRIMLNMFAQRYAPLRERRLSEVRKALADHPDRSADEIAAQLGYTERRDIDCIQQLLVEARENKNPS